MSQADVRLNEADAPPGCGQTAAGYSLYSVPDQEVKTSKQQYTKGAESAKVNRQLRKTVLVVASRFPPVASVGAIRARKFVKYLGRHGWDPVVITGAARAESNSALDARRAMDCDSLSDVPEHVPVHRLGPVVDNWPGYLTRYSARSLARLTRGMGGDEQWWTGILKWRWQRLHDRFAFPDRGIWRLPAIVRLAWSLHRRHPFDAIITSGMPFSDHLIGLALQSILRRPWLADFRDPWVEYIHWQQWQTEWGGRMVRVAESAVVRRARWVISVNDHMSRRFVSRYRDLPARKFVTIQNGFDRADFPQQRLNGRGNCGTGVSNCGTGVSNCGTGVSPVTRFRLLYAGSLYKTRTPHMVLQAFRRFLDLVPGSRNHVKFDFAGRPGPYVEELTKTCNGDIISYLGMLSHAEALRSMASADVNLILLPNVPGSENDTTTKVYECLGSGRPVLAAVPLDGAAADVLRRSDGVWLCDPDDVDGMTKALAELYRAWLAGTLDVHRPPETLGEFTREYQTGQLAALLDSAVSGRTGPVGLASPTAMAATEGRPTCGTGVSPVVLSGQVGRASLPANYGVVAR